MSSVATGESSRITWQEDSSSAQAPERVLARIAADLEDWLATSDVPPGLLDGTSGVALFFAAYAGWTGLDRYLDLAGHAIEHSLAAITDPDLPRPIGGSLCSGLAGIAWGLDYLMRSGLLESGDAGPSDHLASLLSDLDQILADALVAGLAAGQTDLLHSNLGAIIYLTGRPAEARTSIHGQLADTVDLLNQLAIRDERGARWAGLSRPDEVDLGFAHGAAGITCLLARLVDADVALDASSPLLDAAARWLDSTRLPACPPSTALFPSTVTATGAAGGSHWSRLGWCYGDLGVAVAFLAAGIALDAPGWTVRASDILRHAGRRTPDEGEVADAGLCHGSFGIAQIYRRTSERLGHVELGTVAGRWIQHGLALGGQPDGAAGFRSRTPTGFRTTRTLLQGTAGIGLALIESLVDPNGPTIRERRRWDEWMLPLPIKRSTITKY